MDSVLGGNGEWLYGGFGLFLEISNKASYKGTKEGLPYFLELSFFFSDIIIAFRWLMAFSFDNG